MTILVSTLALPDDPITLLFSDPWVLAALQQLGVLAIVVIGVTLVGAGLYYGLMRLCGFIPPK